MGGRKRKVKHLPARRSTGLGLDSGVVPLEVMLNQGGGVGGRSVCGTRE